MLNISPSYLNKITPHVTSHSTAHLANFSAFGFCLGIDGERNLNFAVCETTPHRGFTSAWCNNPGIKTIRIHCNILMLNISPSYLNKITPHVTSHSTHLANFSAFGFCLGIDGERNLNFAVCETTPHRGSTPSTRIRRPIMRAKAKSYSCSNPSPRLGIPFWRSKTRGDMQHYALFSHARSSNEEVHSQQSSS